MSVAKIRVILTCLLMIAFISNTRSETPVTKSKYNSLLWEITGNGMTKPSYLYGTMHVSQKVAFHLTDTFFLALNKCNTIALEQDPGTWMEEMFTMGGMFDGSESSFNRYSNFYKNAFKIELPKNKDLSQSFSFQSELVNGLLYRFYSNTGNFEENTYLDLFIYQSGKKIGKTVVGLESFSEGMESSIKASMPDSGKTKNSYESYGRRSDIFEAIENAYRSGDLDLLDSLSRVTNSSKNMQKYIIDERNKVFVARMDSIMKTSTTLFTGVGAAHLPGENGVINMLRNKGYSVRPVAFLQSKNADKEKQRIETTFRSNTYSPQSFPDSSVSWMTPGKFHRLVGGATSLYLYTDMTNGAYYSVLALSRFEIFSGQTISYTLKRIDSLLYESVPGKILNKKYSKTSEGYPVIDITNRNRRGDVSRNKVIVAPEYIYIFNLSGTGDYVLEREHDKYFNSVKLALSDPAKEWKKIEGDGGGYSLEIPGNVYNDVKGGGGMINTSNAFIHSYNPADSSFYLFMRSNYPDYDYIEEDTFELTQLADQFADQFNLTMDEKIIEHENAVISGKHTSLRGHLKNDSMSYFIRIVINGPFYNLLCCKPGSKDMHERFLNSFKIEPLTYDKTFEELTDSILHFKVMTFPEKENKYKSRSALRRMASRSSDDDEEFIYGNAKTKSRKFRSPLTEENISVTYAKYNPFYSAKDPENFWKRLINKENDNESMLVKNKSFSKKDSVEILSFLFTDTASTRAIMVKMILQNNALYTLKSVIDTLTGPGTWITTFYETFRPFDTTASESVFIPKDKKLVEYLFSNDSVKNKLARKTFSFATIDSTIVPELTRWMKDTVSLNTSSYFRENVLRHIGFLKHKSSIPFLKEYYTKSEDSTDLQLAILDGLAGRGNLEGTMAFKELLLKDAPLTEDQSSIRSAFSSFYDTLELAAKLFPEILKLTTYPEYKTEVYSLLAAVKLNHKISKETYRSFLPSILRDANDQLKRVLNTEDDDEDYSYEEEDEEDDDIVSTFRLQSEMTESGSADTGSRSKLYKHKSESEDYAILLSNFYQADNGVKNFFNKIQKAKNKELVMRTHVIMLHDSVPVADSVWKGYASAIEYRSKLYNELKRYDRLDKFDTTYLNQSAMTESMLFNFVHPEKDSIQFIEKRMVSAKNQSGFVYIYKFKKEDATKWKLGYTYFQPDDVSKVDVNTSCGSETLSEKISQEKQIEKIYKKIALTGRKRAGGSYESDFSLNP